MVPVRTLILVSLSAFFSVSAFAQNYSPLAAERRAEMERGIYHCDVADIAVFPGRMHITCGRYEGVYFSLALNDQPFVDHVLDLARTAVAVEGKELLIQVNTARPDNPAGCLQSDCYRIQSAVLRASVWN